MDGSGKFSCQFLVWIWNDFDNLDCKHARFERDRWSRGSCCCYSSRLRRICGRGSLENSLRDSQALCDYNKVSKLSISLKILWLSYLSLQSTVRRGDPCGSILSHYSVCQVFAPTESPALAGRHWPRRCEIVMLFRAFKSQRLHWSFTLSQNVLKEIPGKVT